MPNEPIVKPLSLLRRRLLLAALVILFLIALPLFIFYASGYRYNPFDEVPVLTATGGMYITTDVDDSTIYINEEPVVGTRTFSSATYLQGLPAGVHRIHVQAPGTHTWVKELAVLPHIVTEAAPFNVPVVPHVRMVTPYLTSTGLPVVVVTSTSSLPYAFATTSDSFVATTSRATSTLTSSREYEQIAILFADKASTTLARERAAAELRRAAERFGFATTSVPTTTASAIATTTVILDDLMLYQAGDDVYVKALGSGREVPLYFCAVTPEEVKRAEDLLSTAESATTTADSLSVIELRPGNVGRECRTDIRINRLGQKVKDFTFMPGDGNLVLLNLEHGLYVVEVDDRSWQNTQLLLPGDDLAMIVNGDRIYASSTAGVVEVYTEVPPTE